MLENGWVKPGAHVISVGACRPTQREMDPALVARARLFVDSRAAALVESGDIVMGIQEGRFGADHIVAELGELLADRDAPAAPRSDTEITIFKSWDWRSRTSRRPTSPIGAPWSETWDRELDQL